MPTADELFRAELDRRGIAYSLTAEGTYAVDVGSMSLTSVWKTSGAITSEMAMPGRLPIRGSNPARRLRECTILGRGSPLFAIRLKEWTTASCSTTSCSIG